MDTISVIIPTRNAVHLLPRLLQAVRDQSAPCEVIVVDSSSSDDTVHFAASHGANAISLGAGRFSHGAARNAGWKAAAGSVVVYLTQDAMPAGRDAVARLVRGLTAEGVAAAFGRQLPRRGASPFGAHARLFNYPPESRVACLADRQRLGIKTAFLSNSFAAYRKEALAGIGGFDETVVMGEDVCAGARLLLGGYAIAYVADAEVYHSHDYSVPQEFRRYFDIGVLHRHASWMLKEFGRAEGEGARYLRSEARFLAASGRYLLFPEFLLRNALKYAGYVLGRNYRGLPRGLARFLSMHPAWWDGE